MMATMEGSHRTTRSPSWLVVRSILACAPIAFLLAAFENADPFVFAVVFVVVLLAGAFTAQQLPANRTLAAIGAAVAVTAAWLLPQRDDIAATAILVFLFTLGAGLAVDLRTSLPWHSRSERRAPAAAIVVLLVLFATTTATVLLVLAALAAASAAAGTVFRLFPTRATTRARAIAFGAVLVATVLMFTGYIGAETPNSKWFGGGTVHGPTNTGEVALTFDDGPNVGATKAIMSILDAHGVKGTFFEVGKAIDADPQITRALYEDGHLLGNHSYNHDQWRWLDPGYPELHRTQAAFERAIGTCPVLYRPPHGDRTPFLANVVRDQHMHMVLWSASAGDWATDDAVLVARRIVDRAKPGAILLLHDGLDGDPSANRTVLVQALPLILQGLRVKGLTPVRLDKLLGTGDYQPC